MLLFFVFADDDAGAQPKVGGSALEAAEPGQQGRGPISVEDDVLSPDPSGMVWPSPSLAPSRQKQQPDDINL